MNDVLIIGGGVVGLSLAWDLARSGARVEIVERGEPGREASWAGAGILPAAVRRADQHPYDQLCGLASELHPRWAAELQKATEIDNGYRRCGGLYLAHTPGEAAALAAWAADQREEGVEVQPLTAQQVEKAEPALAMPQAQSGWRGVYLVPAEAQLRNPRHLKALLQACLGQGVTVSSHTEVVDATLAAGAIDHLQTSAGPRRARQYCFTTGAWTGQLLAQVGVAAGIVPIRGQMVLFRGPQPLLRRIINVGSRYLVPRDDGRLLAGSTEEEAGFDKRTTEQAIADLVAFARGLAPELAKAQIERTWAGLRPGSFDGLPYLGKLPGLENAFVAAGHFRSGLFLSPATAIVMSQLLRGQAPSIDLAPFRVIR